MSKLSDIWVNPQPSMVKALMLLAVVYVFIFHVLVPLGEQYVFIRKLDQTCVARTDNDTVRRLVEQSRGKQYYLTGGTNESSDLSSCGVTIWEASHLLMHLFIGYWLDLRYSLALGVGFEIYEWWRFGCENVFDVLYNSIGAVAGAALRVATHS